VKIIKDVEISRVVYPQYISPNFRGLIWVTGTGRVWRFPKFGVRVRRRWIFPLGP
jgi:hypothetical protein